MTTRSDELFESTSADETSALGARLGTRLQGGEVVLLTGELGSGKTTLIRGLAEGLGVEDRGAVHSPSYTLVNTYAGRIVLTHIDAYFMHSAEDLLLCGFEETAATGGVIAIEWADRLEQFEGIGEFLPADAIRIVLTLAEPGDEDRRKILIKNSPGSGVAGAS